MKIPSFRKSLTIIHQTSSSTYETLNMLKWPLSQYSIIDNYLKCNCSLTNHLLQNKYRLPSWLEFWSLSAELAIIWTMGGPVSSTCTQRKSIFWSTIVEGAEWKMFSQTVMHPNKCSHKLVYRQLQVGANCQNTISSRWGSSIHAVLGQMKGFLLFSLQRNLKVYGSLTTSNYTITCIKENRYWHYAICLNRH